MDNVTLIRVVAGVLFCVVLFMIQRRRTRVHEGIAPAMMVRRATAGLLLAVLR